MLEARPKVGTPVQVRFTKKQIDFVRRFAKSNGVTLSEVIRHAVDELHRVELSERSRGTSKRKR